MLLDALFVEEVRVSSVPVYDKDRLRQIFREVDAALLVLLDNLDADSALGKRAGQHLRRPPAAEDEGAADIYVALSE